MKFIESEIQFDFDDYNKKIIIKRNKLAHEPENEQNGLIYFGDLEFTNDECKNIRKDIRKYKDLFDKILSEIRRIGTQGAIQEQYKT